MTKNFLLLKNTSVPQMILVLSMLLLYQCEHSKNTPPNILLILTDDQGYGDLGFHGNSQIQTPRLDQFFSESSYFPQFYVSPVCAPTRASLLTGRYYQRTGVHGVTRGRERMQLKEETMANLFQNAGYRTAIFGKWHNGSNYPYHPLARGFDHFTGFTSGHYPSYFDTEVEKDGKSFRTQGYLPNVLSDEALSFMKDSQQKNQPFFCYVAFQTPHTPLHVPDAYFEKYQERGLDDFTAAIYGMTENIDANFGRLLDQLEQMGIENETIVIFLSDNGPLTNRYNNGFKGRKGSVDEGGVRVPFAIRWPGKIPSAKRIEGAWAHIDVLPSLLELTQIDTSPKNPLDGISFVPQLFTDQSIPKRTLYENWGKRIRILKDSLLLTRDGLYNLANDPAQKNNLQDSLTQLKDALMMSFNQWEKQLPKTPKILPFQLGLPSSPTIHLEASQAQLHPPFAFRKDRRHTGIAYHSLHGWAHDWIDYWTLPSAYAEWELLVHAPTRYEVYFEYGLDPQNQATELFLQANQNTLFIQGLPVFEPIALPVYDRVPREQEAPAMKWNYYKVGELSFKKGTYPLRLHTAKMGTEKSIELKSIHLVPIQ